MNGVEQTHWMLKEEVKWRTIACAAWTWITSFLLTIVFLLFWMFSPWKHVFVICEYLSAAFSFQIWMISACIATLTSVYIKIFMHSYTVTTCLKITRFQAMSSALQPWNVFCAAYHAILGGLITFCVSILTPSEYSESAGPCIEQVSDNPSDKHGCVALNEYSFMLILYGTLLGLHCYFTGLTDFPYALQFNDVQQPRFLSIRCHFDELLSRSVKSAVAFLQWYVLLYYMFGHLVLEIVAQWTRYHCRSDCYVMSLLKPFNIFPIFWTLFLSGTFLLLLQNVAWHLFNLYYVKNYDFMVDSIFPEDSSKLLTNNLDKSQPLLVQHLAFQQLADVAQHSLAKRRHLFYVPPDGAGGRAVKWNVVADECLGRIRDFAERIKLYHHDVVHNTGQQRGCCQQQALPSDAPDDSVTSVSAATTLLHPRRPLRSVDLSTTLAPADSSQLNMSSLDASLLLSPPPADVANTTRRRLVVPTPKLWSMRSMKAERSMLSDSMNASTWGKSTVQTPQQPRSTDVRRKARMNIVQCWFKAMPTISLITSKLRERVMCNVFADYYVVRWCVQSVSLLAAASLREDDYGVVQSRLHEVLLVLLDALAAIEKNIKLPVQGSGAGNSRHVRCALRRQNSLRAELKCAIYRVTSRFSPHVSRLAVPVEHKRKLANFVSFRE